MCDRVGRVTVTAETSIQVKDGQMGSEAGGRKVCEWGLKTQFQVNVKTFSLLELPQEPLCAVFAIGVTLSNLIPAESSISDLQHFFVAIDFSDALAFFSRPPLSSSNL